VQSPATVSKRSAGDVLEASPQNRRLAVDHGDARALGKEAAGGGGADAMGGAGDRDGLAGKAAAMAVMSGSSV
jgi:hypothetical protein